MKLKISIFAFILSLVLFSVGQPTQAQTTLCSQTYLVQAGDWLSKIADRFYGNIFAYPAIIEATNSAAQVDNSFATIINPDLIEPDWKLCIPSAEDATIILEQSGTDDEQPAPAAGLSSVLVEYYSTTTGKTGAELKTALNSIIRGHTSFSYREAWDILKDVDQADDNPDNVMLIYSGRSQSKDFNASINNGPDAWNREHIWPASHLNPGGRDAAEGTAAYTDIHHLRPADASINSVRSDKDFDLGGTPVAEAPENLRDGDSFEPRDEVKGDIARMLFYMDTRYEGNDADDPDMPDLILVDRLTDSNSVEIGKLCVLLTWHITDLVSDFEHQRNDKIFQWQGNRNPFIDHPEWAIDIWGHQCGM